MLAPVLACFLGYLAGSIPSGVLVARLGGASDPRSIGSGNIGATNVLRTGRKDLAAITLVLDALKGTLAVLLAMRADDGSHAVHLGAAAAAGAFVGHLHPIFLGFRGGKGVATFLGCLIALSWPAALAFALVWFVTALATRYSSAGALAASAAAPLALALLGQPRNAMLFAALALALWAKHRANIERLIAGTESKIGKGTAA